MPGYIGVQYNGGKIVTKKYNNYMKLYIVSLVLFFSASNCQYNLKTVVEHNKNHDSSIVDDVKILKKSSSSSIWKEFYVKLHGLEKDIPGEYIDFPYIIEYKNRFILVCSIKRESVVFVVTRKNNQLEFITVTEKNNYELFMDKCRNMKYYPIRFVNGTLLKLKNGQLVSDYSIECSSKDFPDPSDIIYLEFKGIFDFDFKKNILELKSIEGPIN
ncbi:hypothetical protein [Akkermansia sp. UBA7059]|uniref:hypothetical protein n=1 Tax=Akkermansia sp. UBA7059 TaxID=1945965 RepID=UPI0025B885A3|nr:hypothetical protein [Akkermansia sp. UBA7059]